MKNRNLGNGTDYVFEDIIGESSAIKNVIRTAKRFAVKNMLIMIYGETGTGKELFAQSIHNSSLNYAGPFSAVNCAAIPDTLFGTVKGAYTGAVDKVGFFELANEGTLFLDEINSMNIMLQAKILRALQEKEIQRIGDTKIRKVNCRIISATNVHPTQLLQEKIMREDLYYRLATSIIHIPPLRVRGNDMDLLIQKYIDNYNEDTNAMIIGILPSLKSLLHAYNWPGNVRELSNVIESSLNMTALNDAYLTLEHLPDYLRDEMEETVKKIQGYDLKEDDISPEKQLDDFSNFNLDINQMVSNYERKILEKVLRRTAGNLTYCGKILNISRQCLTAKLKKYQINPKNYQLLN